LPLLPGDIPNIWFLGPTSVYNPNSISIGSAVLAQLVDMSNKQTDRQTDAHTRTQTTNMGNNRSPNKVNAEEDNLQESVDSECLAGRKRQARK